MYKILLAIALIFGAALAAHAGEVTVEQVYNEYDAIDKIYVMTDPVRHKFCYIVTPQSDAVQMFCFPIEESK